MSREGTHVCLTVRHLSEQSTPRQRASNPCMPVYLTLQPIRSAAHHIAVVPGGLTPPFHPYRTPAPRDVERARGGCFLSLCSEVSPGSPRGGWRSALPGLSSGPLQERPATDRPPRLPVYEKYPRMMPRLALRINCVISSRSLVAGSSASMRSMASDTLRLDMYM